MDNSCYDKYIDIRVYTRINIYIFSVLTIKRTYIYFVFINTFIIFDLIYSWAKQKFNKYYIIRVQYKFVRRQKKNDDLLTSWGKTTLFPYKI